MDECKIMARFAWGSLLSAAPAFAVLLYTQNLSAEEAWTLASSLLVIVAIGCLLMALSRRHPAGRQTRRGPAQNKRPPQHQPSEETGQTEPATSA